MGQESSKPLSTVDLWGLRLLIIFFSIVIPPLGLVFLLWFIIQLACRLRRENQDESIYLTEENERIAAQWRESKMNSERHMRIRRTQQVPTVFGGYREIKHEQVFHA